MAAFVMLLLFAVVVALAPWLGADSRPMDPDRHVPVHPLSGSTGENRA